MIVNELELTKLLVYGTTTLSSDPNTYIRPDAVSSAPTPISFSMLNYLTTGAGRYAKPSEAPLIEAFFNDAASTTPVLANGTYNAATLAAALRIPLSSNLLRFNVSQYTTDPSSSDFIERAYVFGSTGFEIANTVTFTVNGGNYTVNNLEVLAQQDNFDFQSSSIIASTANVFLNNAFDPYGLIPVVGSTTVPVDIIYTGSGRSYSTYTQIDFNTDQALYDGWTSALNFPIAEANFTAALAGLRTNTGYLGAINSDLQFRYYTPDGKKIIYGTPTDDTLTVSSAELTPDVYFGYQMVGGSGNDRITGGNFGDELWGGDGNDTLAGGEGNDILDGGTGNDILKGGLGDDTYVINTTADIITENASQGIDTVKSSVTYTLGVTSNLEKLTLTGTSAINGTGNSSNNTITGNTGNNTLDGGGGIDTLIALGGNDILVGGFGNDILTGGTGNDAFGYFKGATVSSFSNLGVDSIEDFSNTSQDDQFLLSKSIFSRITTAAGATLSAADFAVVTTDTAALGSSASIIYNSATGNIFYNADGSTSGFGGGGAFANLITKPTTITATDFLMQA